MAKTSGTLLTFFAVVATPPDDVLELRRIRLSADVQEELSTKFTEMASEWQGTELQRKRYAPTFHPNANQVIEIRDFTVPPPYSGTTSAQSYAALTLPLLREEQLRAIVAVDAKPTIQKTRFLFQACDQRHLLGHKFVLFQDRDEFRRLDGSGLTITDRLAAVIENGELLFRSYFQARRFLPLEYLYREASDDQVKTLLTHTKLKLPQGTDLSDVIATMTPTARKKAAAILDSKMLDAETVTADKIKSYAKKYRKIELDLRTGGGQRRIEIPTDRKQFFDFLRCLDEEFYTSELTERPCETNSYRQLDEDEID